MTGDSPKIFAVFQNVARSYEATKLYRDIKTSGAIVYDKNLILLKEENIINSYSNVISVGQDPSNKGSLFYTNVRFVWFSYGNESFNISIPWIQI